MGLYPYPPTLLLLPESSLVFPMGLWRQTFQPRHSQPEKPLREPAGMCLPSTWGSPWGTPGICTSHLWSSNKGPPNTSTGLFPKLPESRMGQVPLKQDKSVFGCLGLSWACVSTCICDHVCANVRPSVPLALSPSLCQLSQLLFSRRSLRTGTNDLQPASSIPTGAGQCSASRAVS